MSLTINAQTYTGDTARSPDSFRYNGPANTFSSKDYVDVWRKAPISNGSSEGKGRSFLRLTRTLTDGTDAVGDAILKVELSVPVGAARTQLEKVITDVGTFLLIASADTLLLDHTIVQ